MPHDPGALRSLAQDYARAWSSKDPAAVASFYAPLRQIQINRGDVLKGRDAVNDMAAGFYAEFPDLMVYCDDVRTAGDHVIFVWTLEGHHADTGNHVKVAGWEEWEIDGDMKVATSLGWFDADDYDRQVQGRA